MLKRIVIGLLVASAGVAPLAMAEGNTVVGALIGAGVGSALGHSVGGRNSTAIGGVLGAMTGAAIASNPYRDDYYGRPVRVQNNYYTQPSGYYGDAQPVYSAPPVYNPPVYYNPGAVYVAPPAAVVYQSYPDDYESRHARWHEREWREQRHREHEWREHFYGDDD